MRALLILPLLAGCMATQPKPMYAHDGEAAFHVECRRSMDYCYDAALAQCPAGYLPLEKNGSMAVAGVGTASGGTVGSMRVMDLIFRCK